MLRSPLRALHRAEGFFALVHRRLQSGTAAGSDGSSSSAQQGREWAVISGFSKFASRRDLDLALGEHVQPLRVDALLDQHRYFLGSWLLCLDKSKCTVEDLQQQLKAPPQTTGTEPMGKLELKGVLYTPGQPSSKYRLASELGITGCTVRLRNVRYNMGIDALLFFFRDFDLGPGGIEKIAMDTRFNQYLVHFRSPAEAERAMNVLNLKTASGNAMHLIWYTCCLEKED